MSSETQNIFIFGGHGNCALHITRQLLAQGTYTVHSAIRDNPAQHKELEDLGAHPITLDIATTSTLEMSKAIASTGSTTVLWCAAAGYRSTPEDIFAVDQEGAIRTMDAATQAGAKRYISISALDLRDRSKVPFPPWYDDKDKDISERVYKVIKPHLDAKFEADKNLVTENERRGLDYTIVRPNGLSDEAGKGEIEAGKVHLGQPVSREDVASTVVECIKHDSTKGLVFDVVGGATKITDAVGHVARERIDTFEGMY